MDVSGTPIYTVTAFNNDPVPVQQWQFTTLNPSGDEEWEDFVAGVAGFPCDGPSPQPPCSEVYDVEVLSIPDGVYDLLIEGLGVCRAYLI